MPAYSQNVEMASFVTMPKESLGIGGIVGCVVAAFVMGKFPLFFIPYFILILKYVQVRQNEALGYAI